MIFYIVLNLQQQKNLKTITKQKNPPPTITIFFCNLSIFLGYLKNQNFFRTMVIPSALVKSYSASRMWDLNITSLSYMKIRILWYLYLPVFMKDIRVLPAIS